MKWIFPAAHGKESRGKNERGRMSEMTVTVPYRLYGYPNLLLIAAAVVPAVLLMLYVYKKDRLEKEPKGLLLTLVIQGIVSTSLAVYAERLGTRLLLSALDQESLWFRLIFNFLIVGLSEEGFKYLLLYRRTWESPHFNCQFDAVVYAVFVSMGFALWENIEYVVVYGFGTAVTRALTAVPGHACFGVFMGAWYGLARAHENKGNQQYGRICRRMAVVSPALLHGLYDFIATVDETEQTVVFLGFILILFAFSALTVRCLSARDRYI